MVLGDLQTRAADAGGAYPLRGWLQHGAWASWAKAVMLLEQKHYLSVQPVGVTLKLPQRTLACKLRDAVVGTSACTLRALQQRVGHRWHASDIWCLRAVRMIRLVARAAGPASSSAYAKLLNFLGRMPLRQGTRSCVWCGELHFSDDIKEVLRYGCFRPALRCKRRFSWLVNAAPTCWLELTQSPLGDSAKRLGLLSRVLI
eukprot:6481307-Amphidinium_carterae.1